MKRIILFIGIFISLVTVCYGQTGDEKIIDGYFHINDNRIVPFFLEGRHGLFDRTETGVKAGKPFMIYITEPTSGIITWQVISSVGGAYITTNINNGHIVRLVTNSSGTLKLLATDSNGNSITITVYISDWGLE